MAKISRRSFLKGTLAAGAVAAAGIPATAAHAEEMEAPQAGYSFETAPEPIADEEIKESFDADVIVVGAGASGLITTLSALESGLNVICVTASNAPVSRGGSINACYSKAMEEAGLKKYDASVLVNEIAQNMSSVDQAKWYKHYNNSEMIMNWLIDIMEEAGYKCAIENTAGIEETSVFYQSPASHCFYDPAEDPQGQIGMGMPFVVNTLAKKIEDVGGTIVYQNKAVQLVREDNNTGRVVACITQDADGNYYRYNGSKAIVLATGDFSKDKEMMQKYCGWYVDQIPAEKYEEEVNYDAGFDINGLFRGDGHKMGLWVGAAWQKNQPNAVMDGSLMCGPHFITYQSCWSLLLNRKGKRYMNEYTGCVPAIRAGWLQEKGEYWAVWSMDYLSQKDVLFANNGGIGMSEPLSEEEIVGRWDSMVDDTTVFKADTIEELVEKLGLPYEDTLAEISRYNEMCENGEDLDFHKQADKLIPVVNGPFYAEKNRPGAILTVLGGLRTNENMQVCDANDDPIPGLYNVGTMVGDFYHGLYSFQVTGLNYGATCMSFGYLTGKYIAENE